METGKRESGKDVGLVSRERARERARERERGGVRDQNMFNFYSYIIIN
jgi:hypothetical protein